MSKFETVVLYSPDLTQIDLDNLDKNLKNQFNEHNGKIIAEENWGLRDLSYKIKKNKKAFYKLYQIEINGDKIQAIKKVLNQNEQILRHLFVKVNNHEELPTKLIGKEN